jgi:hypothetical protein
MDADDVMDTRYTDTICKALALLRPRQLYAAAVLRGWHSWSGADLRGKARQYGAHYRGQRLSAEAALREAGGELICVEHGRKVAAVLVREEEDGSRIYVTRYGTYRLEPGKSWAQRA